MAVENRTQKPMKAMMYKPTGPRRWTMPLAGETAMPPARQVLPLGIMVT